MKKILFIVALTFSIATFAQKDEIKVLKRLDNSTSQPNEKNLEKITNALNVLDSKLDILSDEDKSVYHYFKFSKPIMEIMLVAMNNPKDLGAIQKVSAKYNSVDFLESMSFHYNSILDIEKKIGKKKYSDSVKPMMESMKQQLSQSAFQLNKDKKYKEASEAFYALYKFDKSNGSNLENAAILSVQAQDYISAEKLYDELKSSDYLNNGVLYYAVNKASNQEETFNNRDDMVKMIALGSHEKPRTFNVSEKKPEVYKMLAILSSQNGNIDKAKIVIDEALKLNPNDADLKSEGARIHFNEAYQVLKDDQKLVDELNDNLDNKDKYDELTNKRKNLFKQALPSLEKAYSLNSEDNNVKILLKSCYEILEMKDKATTIK